MNRFHQPGQVWWQGGAARVNAELAPHLTRCQAHELGIDDPALAAAQFNWLVLSEPLKQAMSTLRGNTPAKGCIATPTPGSVPFAAYHHR